ncbi:leucyl-trna synthetase [Stylonychia lemnae]|uniref:leucine--tRNA ligase n=1 Tax=Stylonychia lemnae TaxID=5949 RepID=A0A077ZRM3_STYLE|nr:leucyl-trna synthetase [Stylonychia lemnae]|eukprot:CDW72114.1 leucyl-trna synthetase [Stylonychia lemnae]
MYILGQFPYPSGNIHMGHVRVYTICDVLTRYYKLKGMNVINPMGWDSFGLPAENAAISRGIQPSDWTVKNIQEMKDQLHRLGFDFDWDRELATHTPEYYKHTQQIFLELYKQGLAYKKDAQVNWDPVDQTVLANEQIDDNGRSWRSGALVEKKMLKQWFFNIRKYADQMLINLDKLNKWPEIVKEAQRGWIGKSEGAIVEFMIKLIDGNQIPVKVFTTRPDTIFGVTFLALSFENQIIKENILKDNMIDQNAFDRYLDKIDRLKQQGRDLKQIDINNIDEGVLFRNIKAIHPLTGDEIPVYATSYVFNEYGTGSIMGVPFHDDRDCAFAVKNQIDMIQVINGDEEKNLDECVLVNSGEYSQLKVKEGVQKIISQLEKLNKGQKQTEYRLRDWLVSRQRFWGVPIPVIYCEKCGEVPVPEDQLPVLLPNVSGNTDNLKQSSPLSRIDEFYNCKCPKCQAPSQREADTLDTFVDSSWYFLRFLDHQNNLSMFDISKVKKWMPVDIYVGGMEHAIMHLLYARFIHKFLCDSQNISQEKFQLDIIREPFRELVVQGLVKGKTYRLKDNGKYIFQEDLKQYSEDQLKITFEKMSKSKGNGVLPDSMAEKYGVDTLRLSLMFAAPPESDVNFDENFIQQMKSYLDKVQRISDYVIASSDFKILTKVEIQEKYKNELVPIYKLLVDYKIKIEDQRFIHVSIARLMELTNLLSKIKIDNERNLNTFLLGYAYLIQALYPIAPHLSNEIWQGISKTIEIIGFNVNLSDNRLDDFRQLLSQSEEKVKIKINMDGKFLGQIDIPKELIGQSQQILDYIRELRPSNQEVKKIDDIVSKEKVEQFVKVISFNDKPIINFITK